MSRSVVIELEMPGDLRQFRLPRGVNRRLQELLDKIQPENIHGETEWGSAVGREAW